MSESLIFLSQSLIRSFCAKNEQFTQKTDELIPKPGLTTCTVQLYMQYIAERQEPSDSI